MANDVSASLLELRFTSEQARFLRDLICSTEAQIGVLTDALYVLAQQLPENEQGTRAIYLALVSQELRTRLAHARIATARFSEATNNPYRIEALH